MQVLFGDFLTLICNAIKKRSWGKLASPLNT